MCGPCPLRSTPEMALAERGEKAERNGDGKPEKEPAHASRPERSPSKADKERGGRVQGPGAPEPISESADPVPSIPPLPAAGPWRSYKEIVAQLAGRIVEAQRPIRVLQALRWDDSVEEQFLKHKRRELPKVDAEYYATVDLGFEPRAKVEEFEDIARDIDRELGEADAIGNIMATHRARVPRRRAHARRARHAALLRLVAQALRLAEGQVPRRQDRRCATSGTCCTASSRTSTTRRSSRDERSRVRAHAHRRRRRRVELERAPRALLRRHDRARRRPTTGSSPTPPRAATT